MMVGYRKYFTRALGNYYPNRVRELEAQTEKHFETIAKDISFAANSRNPIDRRLEFCGYFLALIKSLDAAGEGFLMIRKVCLEVVTEYVRPKNKIEAFARRLLPILLNTWLAKPILGNLQKRVSQRDSPDGFMANILTDKEQTLGFGYGIDILECGICKLFTKHNFSKYISILCEVDEITSSLAGLKLIRTGTIATGSKKCDFRFIKNN
ncbi:L-2-amino-thiazoline-4-carboxylic acid hydrolase [Flavihumibacter fluvii]|uniref:L-2-amino-thiazoline-4-carboxylic acid hydrolase n=1 Tax=Flavihumibacter fluvii TaxID=2838157 RepID=UPI001BDE2EAD|nr:L-2-amino-thiazoline-4-carboxylic acid hydrolase [Flavihumibacter fluvii]ULQ52577.1 L-2-amino-thiazoline-4-carboxylic acid hydrolase [Flavihumibacter fluvii]